MTDGAPALAIARLRSVARRLRAFAVARRRPLSIGCLVFVLAALAFRWARARAGYWTIDDAGITYAAAFELADHGTRAMFPEGTPVESYSNPLVFFIVALLRWCGWFDVARTHVHLETLGFAAMVTLVWSMLRAWTDALAAIAAAAVFALIELATPATWAWYGSGLENVWVSAGLVLLVWLCARTARGVALSAVWGAAAFCVAITRPEAPVYVAGFYVALVGFARPRDVTLHAHLRQAGRALAVTLVLYALFLLWRRIGYGDWWPNTFYAKVAGSSTLADHVRDYVVGQVLRYGWSALFGFAAIALLVAERLEVLARCLAVMLLAALALPITAGADWMGEHRFATAFFVMTHVAYASFAASSIARVRARGSGRRVVSTVLLVLVVPMLLVGERLAAPPVALNGVTLGHIAREQGGVRWQHQMRLGLPNPVVVMPDAGGSLLVGGMQLVDSASLADFQLARIRKYDAALATPLINQYQHEERRADLVHFNTASGAVDPSYLGTRYLQNESHFAVRRDLVIVPTIDPAARVVLQTPTLTIYLSPETVGRAAPSALVRCELIVAWSDGAPASTTHVRISIAGGDSDDISLAPYQRDQATGSERRGLLIGAPSRPGGYPIAIELEREGEASMRGQLFELVVRTDPSDLDQVAAELVRRATPAQAAHRIAWLREQLIPRLSTQHLIAVLRALYRGRMDSGNVGRYVEQLRWTARLAAFETLPSAIRAAELDATRALLATCSGPAADDNARASRLLCLGRAVDTLRRLGYLGTLARVPAVAAELAAARDQLDRMSLSVRYRVLVALALADPSDITLQRRLLASRRGVALAGELVPL
ncbi:MAG TPA: hypothetical protein VIV40_02995 [Kofleriaceae bacterium]